MEIILSNLPENLEVDEKLSDTVKEAVEKVGQLYALDNAEVSITLTDNEHIHEINREYRKVDRPTDVISFALNEGDEPNIEGEIPVNMLGDIIISVEKAIEQAGDYGHSVRREIAFLTVHGMLHLLGYDHIEEADRVEMRKEEDFVMGLSIYMACLREKKRYSTAKSYQDALNSFKCFCGMEAIPYAYINRNRLLCYQSWLLDKGRSLNTVSTYMRRIRHIYNLAVEANEAPFVPNLFKDVFTGVESKRKKALPLDSLRSLMGTPRVEPEMRRTQLCFCLMFSFSGMAFVDFAHLRKENVKDGVLSYHRQKSGSFIRVEIPADVRLLLDELAVCTDKDSPYLFPFLSGKKTGEAAYAEYNGALLRFNRNLRSLAETCGVGEPVTSYTIRHSFATTLKEQDVPIEMISELLGHTSIKTTQIYLKSFSLERLSAVNRACFESVYKPVSEVG